MGVEEQLEEEVERVLGPIGKPARAAGTGRPVPGSEK
jgi:hypothetical protein